MIHPFFCSPLHSFPSTSCLQESLTSLQEALKARCISHLEPSRSLPLLVAFQGFLKVKQIIFLSNVTFPAEFVKRNIIDEKSWRETLKNQIVRESADLAFILVDGSLDVFILYFGILPWLWNLSSKLIFMRKIADKSKPIRSEILQSMVFATVIFVMNSIIKLPFFLITFPPYGLELVRCHHYWNFDLFDLWHHLHNDLNRHLCTHHGQLVASPSILCLWTWT